MVATTTLPCARDLSLDTVPPTRGKSNARAASKLGHWLRPKLTMENLSAMPSKCLSLSRHRDHFPSRSSASVNGTCVGVRNVSFIRVMSSRDQRDAKANAAIDHAGAAASLWRRASRFLVEYDAHANAFHFSLELFAARSQALDTALALRISLCELLDCQEAPLHQE